MPKRRKSPVPFIIGGITIAMALAAIILALNQGAVVEVRGPKGEALDEAPPGSTAGPKPFVNPVTGSVKIVADYIQENAHDPDIDYVKWTPPIFYEYNGRQSWEVRVRYRAKNAFGAWRLTEGRFLIRDGKVVHVEHDD